MRRLLRLVAALLVAAIGVGLGPSGVVLAQDDTRTGPPATPDGGPAIDDLVGCVAASKQLAVLFLIDESASLKASDPDDGRVAAAQTALDSLISLATAEGAASPKVDVAFSAFSNEYRSIQPWTSASTATAPELRSSLNSFADLNSGIDTDFVNALTAANDSLTDRSAEITQAGGAPPCRAILLFTDGTYDLAVRGDAEMRERLGTTKPYAPGIELTDEESVREAEKLGRAALCKEGGVADQVRSNDVTLLTVALSVDLNTDVQVPLAAATAGTATRSNGNEYPCGTQPARGAFLPASGVDVLVARFNEVGTRLAGGNALPGAVEWKVCAEGDECDGVRTFTLDQGLRRVQILALPPETGATLHLEDPAGRTVDLSEAGSSKIGDTPIEARSVADRGLTVDIERPGDAAAWDGEWKASIVDPTGDQVGEMATLQVFVFSDLSIQISALKPWFRGQPTDIEATLTAPEGIDVESLVTAAEVTVSVRNPITNETFESPLAADKPTGPYKGSYTVPEDLTANGVELTVSARITTSSGAELLSQSVPREVLVQRPEGSIQILPPSLKMPSLTGQGSTETDIILQPGSGAGCVWFGKVEVPTAPEGAAPIELTIDGEPLPTEEADCIPVPADAAARVTLKATPAGRASGTVRGWMQMFEKVDGRDGSTTTELQFRFDLSRGVDEAQRLLLTALLLVGGLALPMVALLVINALTARFQTLDVVRGSALPVRVSRGEIFRTEGMATRSFVLRDADFESLAGLGTTRSFAFGGVRFRAKASRNPFGATVAMAAPEGGAEKLKGNAGSRVELDPGLAGSWVFLLDSNKTRRAPRGDAEGLLIAFVSEGDAAEQTQKLSRDIQARLPKVAENLSALLRSVTPKAKPSKSRSKATAATDAPDDAAMDADDEAIAPPDVQPVEADEVGAGAAAGVDVDHETPSIEPDEPELRADDAPEDLADTPREPPPAAPVGFGGAATAAPLPKAPAPRVGDDDGPAAPPTGFTGGPRS
ncbi:MAG: VWA domain-containing protein [Acidimicrobiales bacterium]|nr:VWA domain-containing protein [Acidimicrobiales bacterium]